MSDDAARDPESDALYARLKAYEGSPAAVSGRGRDPVNAPMIRHWCEVMGHTDPACAGPDPVAPPAMLQAWTMGGLSGRPEGRPAAYGELLTLLDEAGCTAVIATDCEQEYLRPLRPGDEITFDAVLESVSPRKTTRLGTGHFITTRTEIQANGRLAGTHRFRILKYAPRPPAPPAAPAERPRPVVNRDNAGFWEGVAAHTLLIQRCDACGTPRFPWLPGCGSCGSPQWTAVEASGDGSVYSYVVVHHPAAPGFEPPYAVGLVELAEGVRMISNVVGVAPDEVRVGMPVRLEFAEADGLTLPLFRAGPGALPRGVRTATPPTATAGTTTAGTATACAAPSPARTADRTPASPVPPGAPASPVPRAWAPGDVLAPLTVPVTRTLIVAGALASRDYQDVHHDPEAARAKGAPDIFMNILTTNGLVGRFLTERLGPGAVLRALAVRLGVPNYPGDELVLTGSVTSVAGAGLRVALAGTNRLGRHVTGTATVALPGRVR
ncbi:protein dehydratase [Streptomyces cinnamoneus]|uniref:Protein dehydratase n=1 Tax=Streptomyces cinnamoneus TaxID=53446 RepID=A0A2G1XH65_STRCJ|nr:protein dehydratase [Streptomyces cinnamoneus]PPT14161.1 protein dehydratase [Streptomyces cinnamoneus]